MVSPFAASAPKLIDGLEKLFQHGLDTADARARTFFLRDANLP